MKPLQGNTSGEVKINGSTITYQAEANTLPVYKATEYLSSLFYTYYQVDSSTPRPITFVMNGGPGSASAWLNFGAMGPFSVDIKDSVPGHGKILKDNPNCWLEFSDLVFLDPPGTGHSHSLGETSDKDEDPESLAGPKSEFFEVEKDLDILSRFVGAFLSAKCRWDSKLFLAGESYGGYRVARMSKIVQEQIGATVAGVILISPALEFSAFWGSDYDVTPWVDVFPSICASALYHRQSKAGNSLEDLQEVLIKAEHLAAKELGPFLLGEELSSKAYSNLLKKISKLSGLSTEFIDKKALRISGKHFCRELLKNESIQCGLYDGALVSADAFPGVNDLEGPDPSFQPYINVFSSAANHYYSEIMGLNSQESYRLVNETIFTIWKRQNGSKLTAKPLGATDDLRYALALNPEMKIMILHGYFDMSTPYYSSKRIVQMLQFQSKQSKSFVLKNFFGGHMFYLWDEPKKAFAKEAKALYSC